MERLVLLKPYLVLFMEKSYEKIVLRMYPELRRRARSFMWQLILPAVLLCLPGTGSASVFKGDATVVSSTGFYQIASGSNSVGGVWSGTTINMSNNFDVNFEVRLGNSNGNGAEGFTIVFLKRNTVALGNGGGSIGIQGIDTSLAIEFDTRGNGSTYDDPGGNGNDHAAVRVNGNFSSTANLSGNISIVNLEDGNYHSLRVKYTASTTTLEVYIDTIRKINLSIDIVNDVFYGQNNIYWGVSGATANGNNTISMKNFSTPLPVTLAYFYGEKVADNNELHWATASEHNAERFEIYRSTDGDAWSLAGSVICAGFSSSITKYNYSDHVNSDDKMFYMLRQVDFNGNDEYFQIIEVSRKDLSSEVMEHFYDMEGNHVFYGKIAEFLKSCEPGKVFISDSKQKYMRF